MTIKEGEMLKKTVGTALLAVLPLSIEISTSNIKTTARISMTDGMRVSVSTFKEPGC